jgi:hypothetical protein
VMSWGRRRVGAVGLAMERGQGGERLSRR